jgi:uncharacterized membrane protein (DUF4010 family)
VSLGTAELFYRFGSAVAIGFLIGLQRELSFRGENERAYFAGVRTFTLLGLAGCTGALVAETARAPGLLVAVIVVLGALVIASYVATSRAGDVGTTTEVAALVTVLDGALCYLGFLELAAAIAIMTTVVLSAKLELKRFVAHITRDDLVAVLKFGVVTAVVLPVLPDEGLGPPPLDVFNPQKIWLMVVLISAISFIGYVLIHVVGPRRGIGLTGLLGGLVSSTAVTLSYSGKSRGHDPLAKPFAVAILLAWTMMFARVVTVVALVNRDLVPFLWVPMASAATAALAYCAWLQFSEKSRPEENIDVANPFELGPALRFGLLYGAILLVSRLAEMKLGERGVYLSALAAGLADVDAITLSLAEMSRPGGTLSAAVAGYGVILAAMANTAVKAGIVLAMGAASLKRIIWPGMLLILAAGVVAVLWQIPGTS